MGKKMMNHLGILIAVAMILLGSCQRPPQEAINAASDAYQLAEGNPDTLLYAPDSFRAAQEKFDALSAELDVQSKKGTLLRNYSETMKLAAEAQSAAEKAEYDAVLAKEQVKTEAEAVFKELDASITVFETKLRAARRVPGVVLGQDILTIAPDAKTAVTDARNDFEAGSFAAAIAKAFTIRKRLKIGETRIEEATRLAKKR